MTIINTSIGVLGMLIGVLGTLIGLAGLIVSSISLHRVGTIQKVVEYNDIVDKYNNSRIEIQNQLKVLKERFINKIDQPLDNHKKHDFTFFGEFTSIMSSLKKFKSIENVQLILDDCDSIAHILSQIDLFSVTNTAQQKVLIRRLSNIITLLDQEGVRKDGK